MLCGSESMPSNTSSLSDRRRRPERLDAWRLLLLVDKKGASCLNNPNPKPTFFVGVMSSRERAVRPHRLGRAA